MRKLMMVMLMAILAMALIAPSVFASGDKVRGDEGDGSVIMEMNQDPNCWDEWWT